MTRTRGREGRTALSEFSRALPSRPNLRYLKLEAKRRLAAGEFASLHDAQLAIAREHGHSSWAKLKEVIDAQPGQPGQPGQSGHDSHALTRASWVISRFAQAGSPEWAAPTDGELREQFDDQYLTVVPPETMIRTLSAVAGRLAGDLTVTAVTALTVRAEVGGLRVEAVTEADPPHRLTRLRIYPLGQRVTDPRVESPSTRRRGPVPAWALEVAEESVAELGLPGLVLAGTAADAPWAIARGWADLDERAELTPDHRFPAYSVTKLITATAVLCLVADGRIGLEDPVNLHLRQIRLADNEITVRELLTHTGGVDNPATMFAARAVGLASLIGTVAACGSPRGEFNYSHGGYAMLGQLIAEVTGSSYAEAAGGLVLDPLGLANSSFPENWPEGDAITGYQLSGDGLFELAPRDVCTNPATGGLWTTAADLLRFGSGWAGLLPASLAGEALSPQAARDNVGGQIGLGWLLSPLKDLGGHTGGGPGAAVSLLTGLSGGQLSATDVSATDVSVALANRLVPIEPVNARLRRPAK